jgi:hypothetical protein
VTAPVTLKTIPLWKKKVRATEEITSVGEATTTASQLTIPAYEIIVYHLSTQGKVQLPKLKLWTGHRVVPLFGRIL